MKLLAYNLTPLVAGGFKLTIEDKLLGLVRIIGGFVQYMDGPLDLLMLLGGDPPVSSPHYLEMHHKRIEVATRVGCAVLGIDASNAPAELTNATLHVFDVIKLLIRSLDAD